MKKLYIIFFLLITILKTINISATTINSGQAPDFMLKDINNNDVSLSNYSGRVIILDFWATWCGPCKLELPGYIELYNTYKNKGLVIIGVTIWWDSIDEIVSSIQTNKINYPVLIGNDSVCNLYGGIDGVPTTLIINPQGQIVKTMIGYDNKKAFEDEINKWLQNTSPFILSTSPENKETNVPIDTIIQAVFNKDINSTSISEETFILKDIDNKLLDGEVTYNSNSKTAVFKLSSTLKYSYCYTATIKTGVKDLNSNIILVDYRWSFTTLNAPNPVVLSTSPENEEINVPTNTIIQAVFNKDIDSTSISEETFILKDIDNKLLDGEVTYNSNSKTVIFILSSTLKYSSCYTAIIKTGVKDLDGNNMFADYTWSFTTLSAPDTIPPAILSTSPLNGESNIPVDVIIGVIFNEKINSATVTAKIFKLYDKDNFPVNGTITVKNNKITFIPSNVLEHYSFYTAVVTAGIKDLSGNSSVSDFTWSFTTNKALTSTTEKKKACFISFLPGSGLVKKFRDEYLMTNIIGKFLVDFYCEILSGLFR